MTSITPRTHNARSAADAAFSCSPTVPVTSSPVRGPAALQAGPEFRRQVFLLEPDSGTVCRLLALYAARGLPLERVQLDAAAPRTLMLVVHTRADERCLAILVDKARVIPGVIEAAGD